MNVDQLNTMNAAILPIIREQHPQRIVLLQGLNFGNPSWLINVTALAGARTLTRILTLTLTVIERGCPGRISHQL